MSASVFADAVPGSANGSKDSTAKKPRNRHSAHQLVLLNELYDRDEHPSLDDRTQLAERLGMETKTVNAWFQNKRASNKKRNINKSTVPVTPAAPAARTSPTSSLPPAPPGAHHPSLELPPIASLLASTAAPSSSSATAEQIEIPEYHTDYAHHHQHPPAPALHVEHPSLAYKAFPSSAPPDPHQTAFYAGNPQFRHMYESAPHEPPTSQRPKARSRPSQHQTDEMRRLYAQNPHPSREEREELCERIGMRYQSVTNWFQNQRSLAKRRAEAEDDGASSTRASTPVSQAPSFQHHQHGRPSRSMSKSRRFSPFPSASEHLALPPSLSHLLNREDSPAPSLAGSVDSQTSTSRPRRSRPSPQQLNALKRLYVATPSPSIDERSALALEIGMDLAKVTNWFRNLRQTSRKRKSKGTDDDDELDDGASSRSHSRSGTPATSLDEGDVHMADLAPEHDDEMHTDDDEADEAPTPASGASPAPARAEEPWAKAAALSAVTLPLPPPAALALPSPISVEHAHDHGVRVEDALLLLSFHQHVVAA